MSSKYKVGEDAIPHFQPPLRLPEITGTSYDQRRTALENNTMLVITATSAKLFILTNRAAKIRACAPSGIL